MGAPTAHDGLLRDAFPLGGGESEGGMDGAEIVEDVAAEVGRVIAVDAEGDAGIEVGTDGQICDGGDTAQLDVGQRTHGDHDPVAGELGHDGRVLGQLDAVVDAGDVQVAHGRGHVGHVGLLAGVRGAAEPALLGVGVDVAVQVRRVALLGRREAQPRDHAGLQVRDRRAVHGLAVRHGQVAEHAHDQLRRQAHLDARPLLRRREPGHHRLVRHPARRVRLRVEEDLRVHHPVRVRPHEVVVRQRLKVLRRPEHRHADKVVVQEVVQRREPPVPGQQRLQRGECRVFLRRRQRDLVPRRQVEQQSRFERAWSELKIRQSLRFDTTASRDVLPDWRYRWRIFQ